VAWEASVTSHTRVSRKPGGAAAARDLERKEPLLLLVLLLLLALGAAAAAPTGGGMLPCIGTSLQNLPVAALLISVKWK
jgi:hypothetical protein